MAANYPTSASTALQPVESQAPSPVDYTAEQIQLIKNSFAKGATDAELQLLIAVAKRKGLDIFSRQICLVPRWDSDLKMKVRDPQTTIDGYRLIAERTGRYVPGRNTEYTYNASNYLESATAYVKKLVAGEWHEVAATAFFDEYVQMTREGKPNMTWQKMPHVMLGKCAESLALRRAFPAELSGLYTQEEMGSLDEERATHLKAAPAPKAIAPAPVEVIGEDVVDTATGEVIEEAVAVEQDEPQKITKATLIKVVTLTKRLEELGCGEDEWREIMEKAAGVRHRSHLMEDDAAVVIATFADALNQLTKRRKK